MFPNMITYQKIVLITLFSWFCLLVIVDGKKRPHRDACKPNIDLNCGDGIKRYTYYSYNEAAEVSPGCEKNTITSRKWSLISKSTKKEVLTQTKTTFAIPEHAAAPGNYILKLVATETGGGTTTEECAFKYITEPPVIIFKQGQLQHVSVGDVFTVDITESKFPDKVPDIIWTVECLYKKETEASCKQSHKCKDVAPMKGLSFSATMHECFEDITFKAAVKHDDEEVYSKHIVSPRNDFDCEMTIICEKNCDKEGSHLSNPELPIVLKLKPSLLCVGYADWLPKWIVKADKKLPDEQMEMINDNKRLIIKPNSLEYDDSLVAFAKEEGKFEAWFRVRTTPKISNPECKITPASGTSLKTRFKVSCVSKDKHLKSYAPSYTVYQMVNGKKKLVTTASDDNFNIVLSSIKGQPNQKLIIEGRDLFQNPFECDVNSVTVNEIELKKEDIQNALNKFNALTKDENQLGPQYAAALLNELNQNNINNHLKMEAKADIMNSLSKLNVQSMATYDQLNSITQTLVNIEGMTDSYKEHLGSICKKMAGVQLKQLGNDKYAKYKEKQAKEQAKLNAECADKLLEETIEEEEPTTEAETTTLADVEPVVKEDYPDYELPFEDPINEEIKTDALDIIADSALAVATTLTGGEQYQQVTNNSESNIAVEEGNYMANKRIESGTITVIPKEKFKDEGANHITVIVSNYDRDLLTPRSDLSSNVIEVKFYKNLKRLKNTNYDIEFPVLNDSVPYERFEVLTPAAGDEFLEIDRKMNVHRLELYKMETCLIRFKIEEDIILKVAVSVNQRPRNKHFEDKLTGFIVHANKTTSLTIENPYPRSARDTLFYVAVIPDKAMMTEETPDKIIYDVQFTEIACVEYSRKKHTWISAEQCDIKVTGEETNSTVHCSCKHSSLHSIYYKPIPNRLDIQEDIDYIVVDFVDYIIFIHVLVIFIAYAIALGLTLKRPYRSFGRDRIFFLSDNLKNDKFCYMLVVHTGCYKNSGTTSNIMAQITGSKDTSKPHVLNYPDPACKLLQRDRVDWMILTHSRHLGTLEAISLWTDGIGMYPQWYCEDITVFDLQTKEPYVFKVDKWLSPSEKHACYARIKVFKPDKTQKKKITLLKHLRFHYAARHTWNIFVKDDGQITYPERLTVILSMIYTTYMVLIWLLGPPTLTHSDSFGYGEFHFYSVLLTYPLASSLICGIINFPMVYFLRNSAKTEEGTAFVTSVKKFPFQVRKIIWYVLMFWVLFCLMYLITFGFWVTNFTAFLWMFMSALSLILSIFVWENLYIILYDIITHNIGYAEEIIYRFDLILIEIERQRKILFHRFGEVLLRPYFKKHYKLLTPNELFDLRLRMSKRLEVASLFKEMCLFMLYIGTLYLIVVSQYDMSYNISNKMMHRIVEDSIYADGQYLLDDIETIEDVYNYLEHVIIPTTHPRIWYGNWYAADAGLMADFSTRILGVVQLRQQRRQQKCNVPQDLAKLQIPCTNKAPVFDNWEYHDGSEITSTMGHFQIYDGSGYIANLGRTLRNSKFILKLLRQNKWIDINTAVLFIDFLTYNVNINMFNAVRIYIERSPTGRYVKSCQIYTTRLVVTDIVTEVTVAFLYILLIIVIIIMCLKRFVQIVVLKGVYFNDFWNVLDTILLVLSIVLVALYFVRNTYTEALLKTLVETDHNKFVHYYHLVTISEVLIIVYGLTLCLATLRLWKFLHFGILFRIMERTILKAGPQLAGLFLYQMCVYMMMVIFIFPMYGETLAEHRDYYRSLVTVYLASINFTEHLSGIYTSIDITHLYLIYSAYLLMSLGFNNFYATTLIINLEESKVYYSNMKHLYNIHTYVMDVINFNVEKLRRHMAATRLHGGGDSDPDMMTFNVETDKLIMPKSDEHRYANIVLMNNKKMMLMRLIALAATKNVSKYGKKEDMTDEDMRLMAAIIANLFKDQDDRTEMYSHVFYQAVDPITGRIKFIPDTRILEMEKATRILLGQYGNSPTVIEHTLAEETQTQDNQRLKDIWQSLKLIQDIISHIVIVEDKTRILKFQNKTLSDEEAVKTPKANTLSTDDSHEQNKSEKSKILTNIVETKDKLIKKVTKDKLDKSVDIQNPVSLEFQNETMSHQSPVKTQSANTILTHDVQDQNKSETGRKLTNSVDSKEIFKKKVIKDKVDKSVDVENPVAPEFQNETLSDQNPVKISEAKTILKHDKQKESKPEKVKILVNIAETKEKLKKKIIKNKVDQPVDTENTQKETKQDSAQYVDKTTKPSNLETLPNEITKKQVTMITPKNVDTPREDLVNKTAVVTQKLYKNVKQKLHKETKEPVQHADKTAKPSMKETTPNQLTKKQETEITPGKVDTPRDDLVNKTAEATHKLYKNVKQKLHKETKEPVQHADKTAKPSMKKTTPDQLTKKQETVITPGKVDTPREDLVNKTAVATQKLYKNVKQNLHKETKENPVQYADKTIEPSMKETTPNQLTNTQETVITPEKVDSPGDALANKATDTQELSKLKQLKTKIPELKIHKRSKPHNEDIGRNKVRSEVTQTSEDKGTQPRFNIE